MKAPKAPPRYENDLRDQFSYFSGFISEGKPWLTVFHQCRVDGNCCEPTAIEIRISATRARKLAEWFSRFADYAAKIEDLES